MDTVLRHVRTLVDQGTDPVTAVLEAMEAVDPGLRFGTASLGRARDRLEEHLRAVRMGGMGARPWADLKAIVGDRNAMAIADRAWDLLERYRGPVSYTVAVTAELVNGETVRSNHYVVADTPTQAMHRALDQGYAGSGARVDLRVYVGPSVPHGRVTMPALRAEAVV